MFMVFFLQVMSARAYRYCLYVGQRNRPKIISRSTALQSTAWTRIKKSYKVKVGDIFDCS